MPGRLQTIYEVGKDLVRVFELTFPYDYYAPPLESELAKVFPVVGYIARELINPISLMALWCAGFPAAFVPMPEATMHKNHCAVAWQHDVGPAGKGGDSEPKAIACPMKHRTHHSLWSSILAFNLSHQSAALCDC